MAPFYFERFPLIATTLGHWERRAPLKGKKPRNVTNIVVRGEANDYRNTVSEAEKGFHKQDTHMTNHRKQTREPH